MSTLTPLDEAVRFVLAACGPLPSRRVPLAEALGCITTETIVATGLVPPFANSAMDGYAVRAADLAGATAVRPVQLEVIATLAAGAAPSCKVGPGQAVRIMTGAPMPPGADTVVMVELTERAPPPTEGVDQHPDPSGAPQPDPSGAPQPDPSGAPQPDPSGAQRAGSGSSPGWDRVLVCSEVRPGNHIRPAGDDLTAGQEVFASGTELGPGHLGVLASLGLDRVAVHPKVRVGVLSTGDELVTGAGPLQPGQIRETNRPTLLGLLRQAGCTALDMGTARDTEDEIGAAIVRSLANCDAVVTSGGVSMGDFDWTRVVLDRLTEGTMRWMQVAIRPAKPFAFGVVGTKPVFGLPGNPVSAMVSFECFARPALRAMMGHTSLGRPAVDAIALEGLPRTPDGKLHLLRVRATLGPDGRHHVVSSGGQSSHQLFAMALANALALVPDGVGVAPGGTVRTWLLS